jgi:hypothetical protein
VVAEIALAFVLVSAAALLVRSFYSLEQVDLGIDSTNVVTMWMPMTSAPYPDGSQIISYLDRVRDRVDRFQVC